MMNLNVLYLFDQISLYYERVLWFCQSTQNKICLFVHWLVTSSHQTIDFLLVIILTETLSIITKS